MLWADYYSQFDAAIGKRDFSQANKVMMHELGKILVQNKRDFIDMLNESGIDATADMTQVQLINLFTDNIYKNQQLMLGTSMLIRHYNQRNDFDGDDGVDVKNQYAVLRNYYNEYFSPAEGTAGAIAGAVGDVARSASTIVSGAQAGAQKKKYGALDLAQKKEDTKQALLQSVMAGQQAVVEQAKIEAEQKKKTTRTLIIVGGLVLAAGTIAAFLLMKKNK